MRRSIATAALVLAATTAVSACGSGDNDDAAQDSSAVSAGPDAAAATTEGPAALPTADLEGVPEVVATVNGDEITRDMFVETYEAQFQQAAVTAAQSGAPVDQEALKTQTLESMVSSLLLVQGADEAGITITDEQIDADIEQLATENGAASPEEFLTMVQGQGIDEEQVREEVEKKVKIEAFIKAEGDVEEPTKQDAQNLYDTLGEQQAQSEDAASQTLPPFEDVEKELEAQLTQEAESKAVQEMITDLRSDADITENI